MMFGGMCAYCGHILEDKKWHADHVAPIIRDSIYVRGNGITPGRYVQTGKCLLPENDHIDNVYPACRACNIDKSCSSLEGWRRQLEDRVAVLRRNYSAYRHAERFGLVKQVQTKVVFWFERYEETSGS